MIETEEECKHSKGFSLFNFRWVCNGCYTFRLNFDPLQFIDGVSFREEGSLPPKIIKLTPSHK